MTAIQEERKTWEEIETIKELKEGYLSQVINKIKELVLEYDAVIVLENLNYGFKHSRTKVEKQVYQKFELQLIKKFNYIIDKRNPETYNNAFQLTNPIRTLNDIGMQCGIVFYVSAWNTSQIDPTTGYVNLLSYIKHKNIKESKEFISKIKDIRFNGKYYEFDIDFADYNPKYKETKTNWTICSYGTRIKNVKMEKSKGWESIEVDLTTEFKKLFKEYNIPR
jgi:CRISPR-associated protein Cpf1